MVPLMPVPEQIAPEGKDSDAVGSGMTLRLAGVFNTRMHDVVAVVTPISTKRTASVNGPGIVKFPDGLKVIVCTIPFCEKVTSAFGVPMIWTLAVPPEQIVAGSITIEAVGNGITVNSAFPTTIWLQPGEPVVDALTSSNLVKTAGETGIEACP